VGVWREIKTRSSSAGMWTFGHTFQIYVKRSNHSKMIEQD